MPVFVIDSFEGGISDDGEKGIRGSYKFASNIDPRKPVDSLSAGQALIDEGLNEYNESPSASQSPSASVSPSLSPSPTASASSSTSPSLSSSASQSTSTGASPSISPSPSASASPSASVSPSSSLSLSPSNTEGLTSIFADLIIKFVEAKDGYTYGFGNGGHIYRRDLEGKWIRVYKDPDPINGADEWYNDDGQTFLYWATTTGKPHRKELPGLANWNDVDAGDDWPKSNLTPNVPHTMRECGGSLIICNGSNLALVGYDDSYTNEAVNLIPGNVSKTLVERNGRTIIGTYRESDPEGGFNCAIDTEVPLAQIGSEGEIYYNNMTEQVVLKKFPGGGKVNPGGVAVLSDYVYSYEWEQDALFWIDKQGIGNVAVFGVYDASTGKNGLYTYGRKTKDKPFILNLEYLFDDIDEIGAVESIQGTVIASYQDGSEYGVKRVDSTQKAEGVWEGLELKSQVKAYDSVTVWKYAVLIMKPLPSGSWVEFWYKTDKTGDFIRSYTISNDAQFQTALYKRAVFRINANAEIFEPRIVVHPTGNTTPEIYQLRVYCM